MVGLEEATIECETMDPVELFHEVRNRPTLMTLWRRAATDRTRIRHHDISLLDLKPSL